MLGKLERAVERLVDRGIAGAFQLRVQPAEIGRHLERAMLDGQKVSMGAAIAPNRFLVRLHPDDAAVFSGWELALCRELERWLAELAFARGFVTVGAIQVRLEDDATVPRRTVRTEGWITDAAQGIPADAPIRAARLVLLPENPSFPRWRLDDGIVSVGRADDNDLVVSDPEVSRHHARFEAGDLGWLVSDLASTNGTWVNGEAVARSLVFPGDVVAFGRVRFRVDAE